MHIFLQCVDLPPQVYTGLEVGANKATAAERAQVRDHLIDVADPTKERFTPGDEQ